MKTSRRLLFGTFAVLLAAPVVLVAYGRISGAGIMYELPAPERPTAGDLATLRDFDRIEVRGDFMLEIVSGAQYSVSYTPLPGSRGFLRASVADGNLRLAGYGNRSETTAGSVRITMPALTNLVAESLSSLVIRDFDSDTLSLRATGLQQLALENNRIGTLDMEMQATFNVTMRDNEVGTSRVSQFGATITTE
ncbi:MAG: DUF2807 domain-containing protein [Pseudomonadota bacterium]|nr:DUF2807 domain-containing protein [Pseudomonadota bacterium]